MKTRQFGNTDMHITPIGFGTWALGGGSWAFGWGPQDDEQSIAAIHRALDLGINWIDTAAVYGLGHSEEIVARALKDRSERPYVFTKCSRVWDENGEISSSLKAQSIRRECENSLRRLQVDVIDLYQVHWPMPESELEEGWETMAQLKEAMRIAPISTLQPPYSLVKPGVEEEILPFCEEQEIGVIVYSPMMSGLLSGSMTRERIAKLPDDDWRKRDSEFQEPRLSRNLALVEQLQEIGYMHSRSPGEVAIAWTLHNPAVTAAIVGARRPEQVDSIIGAAEFRLTEAEFDQIEEFRKEHP